MLILASFLCILIDLCERQLQPDINPTKSTISQHLKWDRCSPQRANCTKPRHTIIADGVLKVMVPGRGRRTMGSGQTVVRFGRGPITYPTGQPSESWKYVQTGTSLYIGLRRLTRLVWYKKSMPVAGPRVSTCKQIIHIVNILLHLHT